MIPGMTASTRLRYTLIFLLVVIGPQSLLAAGGDIPAADNLAEVGRVSQEQGIPAVVFVSRDACPYCRTLRDAILKPLFAAGKFEQRAILVEISLDHDDPLTGFENERMTSKAFGRLYQSEITPTLLFLDSEGHEIAKRIVGISNLEFYGFYLQKSIDEALRAIRSGS